MNKAEILEFIRAVRIAYVATVEESRPHVRAIGIYRADDDGILIQVWKIKDIHKQLEKNPEIELCFADPQKSVQVRVSGRAELVEDLALKKQVVEDRPFMKPIVEARGYDVVALYRIKGKATVWTFQTNFEPKAYIDL